MKYGDKRYKSTCKVCKGKEYEVVGYERGYGGEVTLDWQVEMHADYPNLCIAALSKRIAKLEKLLLK